LKPFSKLFQEFSHPRVFGSTTSFSKDFDANHRVPTFRSIE
jgi:hypothetical protein